MSLRDPGTLPYRPCVGIVVLNADGLIGLGRRIGELVEQEHQYRWQMPQGGIDGDEDPKAAAYRELYEETGVRSVEVLAETKDWIHYDLPPEAVGIALKGKFRGQRQKWFAMRFTGAEQEIDLQPAGHKTGIRCLALGRRKRGAETRRRLSSAPPTKPCWPSFRISRAR